MFPQHQRSHLEKALKSVDVNIPLTPSSNKTMSPYNPPFTFGRQPQKIKMNSQFLSPSGHAPFNSPKAPQKFTKRLLTAQTPRSKTSVPPSLHTKDENKVVSPPETKSTMILSYVPTANLKKKASPKAVKTQEMNKPLGRTHKKSSDFSIASGATAATKMKPDRTSEMPKMREVMSNRETEKIIEGNILNENIETLDMKDGIQDGKNMDLNLSPIARKKEDFSSFFSEKEKIMCTKHPLKKAKYRSAKQEGQRMCYPEDFYCSECAIEFALKGTQMVKLPLFGSNSQVNTESDEKFEVNEFSMGNSKEMMTASEDLRKKITESLQEVNLLEQNFHNQKEVAEKKADATEKTIQACSENVIMLFREETEKAIRTLNIELEEEKNDLDKALQHLKWLAKGFNDVKEELKEMCQTKVGRDSHKVSLEEYQQRINSLKHEMNKIPRALQQIPRLSSEDKVNEYKRSLTTVLKEVVTELEKEDPMSERNRIAKQTDYNEQMMKNLGAFEDFLKANESQDALQMKMAKGRIGDNMVVSFGNKEIFEKVLQSPAEAHTLCSTLGETIVVPGAEEVSGRFRPRENRNCVTEEAINEGNRKGANDVEDYIKFMSYIGNQLIDQKDRDNSFQKTLFNSPQFKGIGGNSNVNSYFDH